MKIKNIGTKIVSIGTTVLMPEDVGTFSDSVVNTPAIKVLIKHGFLQEIAGSDEKAEEKPEGKNEAKAEEASADESTKAEAAGSDEKAEEKPVKKVVKKTVKKAE